MPITSTSCGANSRMLALLGLVVAAVATEAGAAYVNTTAGGILRPGVYGNIEVRNAPAPPVIYDKPVVASRTVLPASVKPVYLYVPPGQVRKWTRHCGKYKACDVPVYFVRMDNSPSKLGRWKTRGVVAPRNDLNAPLRTMGGPPGFRD